MRERIGDDGKCGQDPSKRCSYTKFLLDRPTTELVVVVWWWCGMCVYVIEGEERGEGTGLDVSKELLVTRPTDTHRS